MELRPAAPDTKRADKTKVPTAADLERRLGELEQRIDGLQHSIEVLRSRIKAL